MMIPQLRFSKDFDSFTVESDHLDVVYSNRTFRLLYPTNGERKFSIRASGNTKLLMPEMWLECYNQETSHGILVNVIAGFEDVVMLGRFVEKLASVAGYEQVPVDKGDLLANTSYGLEHEDEIDEEIDEANISNQSEDIDWRAEGRKMALSRPRPILMFIESQLLPFTISFPGGGAGYFEVTHDRTYRFAYIPGVNHTFETGPADFGGQGGGSGQTARHRYLVHNVMLQIQDNPNNPHGYNLRGGRGGAAAGPFEDLAEVDVFVDVYGPSNLDFVGGLKNDHFTTI